MRMLLTLSKSKKTLIINLFSILLLLASMNLVHAEEEKIATKKTSLAIKIADHYIPSFYTEAQAEKEAIIAEEAKDRPAHQARPAKLDVATKRKVLFNNILAKSEKFALAQEHMESVLNEYAWDDLKLFYGTTSEPGYHLMSRINRTTTTLGEAALATLLVTPTSNLAVLTQRQHIIKTLLNSPEEAAKLKDALQVYQDSEQSMLSFWTSTDPLYSKEYREYMDKKFYAKGNNASNKSVAWLEF